MLSSSALTRFLDFAAESVRQPQDPFSIPRILDVLCETYGSTVHWTPAAADRSRRVDVPSCPVRLATALVNRLRGRAPRRANTSPAP